MSKCRSQKNIKTNVCFGHWILELTNLPTWFDFLMGWFWLTDNENLMSYKQFKGKQNENKIDQKTLSRHTCEYAFSSRRICYSVNNSKCFVMLIIFVYLLLLLVMHIFGERLWMWSFFFIYLKPSLNQIIAWLKVKL